MKLLEGDRPIVKSKPGFDVLYGIMENCWQTKPDDRPNMVDIVRILDPIYDTVFGA